MGVKVRERDGAWWLFVDHQGRRKAKRVGTGKTGKKAADAAAVQIAAKLASGDPTVFAAPVSPAPTLRVYAQRWLTETIAPHRKQRTEDYYRRMLDCHLLPTLGSVPLTEIKPAQVRTLIADKLNGRACPA
jgi:integrase